METENASLYYMRKEVFFRKPLRNRSSTAHMVANKYVTSISQPLRNCWSSLIYII